METSTTTVQIHVMPKGDAIGHTSEVECICGPSPVLFNGQLVLEHHWLKKREE